MSDRRVKRANDIGGDTLNRSDLIPCRNSGACPLRCLPDDLHDEFGEDWGDLALHMNPLPKRTKIFSEHDRFDALYAIRSGCVKKWRVLSGGRTQIVGFYFPRDIIGFSGVVNREYATTAETLDTTALCVVQFDNLQRKARSRKETSHKLFQLFARYDYAEKQLIRILRAPSADSRVAAFVAQMADRYSLLGFSGTRFRLPMSRKDIANYLGLTVERTSRAFSRLVSENLLRVDNREIEVTDKQAIDELAGVCFI